MIVAETKRLYLRELNLNDAENFYHLNLDKEVLKYTGDEPFNDIDSARTFLQNYDHYSKYGFGRWAVIDKVNDEFLGWCGLKFSAKLDEYDIGFRFFKRHWNKGYATESAMICLDMGFHRFDIQTIVGRAMKKNFGSIRVLEKMQMTFWKSFNFEEKEGVIYSISKRRFLRE